MSQSLIIVGGNLHASVLVDVLSFDRSVKIVGFTDSSDQCALSRKFGIKYLGNDTAISEFDPNNHFLVNGIGSNAPGGNRNSAYKKFKALGFRFFPIVHPSATVSKNAKLGEGVQIMAGAVIQPFSTIGDNTIINTRATVDHDCLIGSDCHIAPGATLSGSVTIGSNVHIGTGASIVQQISIGADSMVGAGAVVVSSFGKGSFLLGIPARNRGGEK
jgi:sugar O-acyltransferase (sialic acid O-acetyltransferase NeuD family)